MARIDFTGLPSVSPTGAPGGADYQRIPTSPGMFGGAIAAGEERLGQGLEASGENTLGAMISQDQLQNEVHGSELANWGANKYGDAFADFSQLQGKAALDGLPAYRAKVKDIYDQALAQAGNLQERALASRTFEYLSARYVGMGEYHAKQEFGTYANRVARDQGVANGGQALLAATQDDPGAPAHMNRALYASDDGIRKLGEQQHWDDDTIAAEVARNRGANLKEIVKTLVGQGQLDKASMIYAANRAAIDPLSSAAIVTVLKPAMQGRKVATAAAIATGQPIDGSTFSWTEKSAGLPVGYIGGVMRVESRAGTAPDRAGSQYKGLAQFGAAERARYGITDPASIAQNASALTQEAEVNAPALRKALGRTPNAAELYLAHQQGLGGAIAQLSNPDRPAWQNLAATGEGRANGAPWAKAAIWGNMTASAKAAFGSVDNVSGADFVRIVKGFYGGGGAPAANGPVAGVIDRAESYRRAQAMFGSDPVFLRQVESQIDHQWGAQEKANQERIADITLAMPNIVSAVADGHLDAATDVPPDLQLLGSKKAEDWQERVSAAKVLGARVAQLPMATPDSVRAMRDELATGLGDTSPLYKFQKQALGAYDNAVQKRDTLLQKDAASYILRNDATLKASFDAAEKAGTPQAMQGFAQQMLARQDYLGVAPDQQRILPVDYAAQLAARWRDPALLPPPKPGEAGGAEQVMGEMQSTARLWGNYWPTVYREIAPKLDPVLRAVAAGGEPAALTKLLNDKALSDKQLGALVADASVKDSDLKANVADALKPFALTVSGSQRSQTLSDYADVVHRLAARYVSEGQDPVDAAKQAATDLLDYNYSFVDESQAHFRLPKRDPSGNPFPYLADDIAAGAQAARAEIGTGDLKVASKVDAEGRGLSQSYLDEETSERVKNDGIWLTAPDESGLVLFQPNGFAVRKADGAPLFLPWSALAALGRDKTAKLDHAMESAVPAIEP